MEFRSDPPIFEVTFDDETPWQRRKVISTLSVFLDEDEYIKPSHNGIVLTASLPSSISVDEVEYVLNRAAQIAEPKALPRTPQEEKLKTNNNYL